MLTRLVFVISMNEMSRVVWKRRLSSESAEHVQKQVIIDLKGFGMESLQSQNVLQATTRIGESYYPDSVHRVYLAERPPIISSLCDRVHFFILSPIPSMCLGGVQSAKKMEGAGRNRVE